MHTPINLKFCTDEMKSRIQSSVCLGRDAMQLASCSPSFCSDLISDEVSALQSEEPVGEARKSCQASKTSRLCSILRCSSSLTMITSLSPSAIFLSSSETALKRCSKFANFALRRDLHRVSLDVSVVEVTVVASSSSDEASLSPPLLCMPEADLSPLEARLPCLCGSLTTPPMRTTCAYNSFDFSDAAASDNEPESSAWTPSSNSTISCTNCSKLVIAFLE